MVEELKIDSIECWVPQTSREMLKGARLDVVVRVALHAEAEDLPQDFVNVAVVTRVVRVSVTFHNVSQNI